MGEQPNPWNVLPLQDVTSRHRGAKPSRRCELLGKISLFRFVISSFLTRKAALLFTASLNFFKAQTISSTFLKILATYISYNIFLNLSCWALTLFLVLMESYWFLHPHFLVVEPFWLLFAKFTKLGCRLS
jgi:hypothetical protein